MIKSSLIPLDKDHRENINFLIEYIQFTYRNALGNKSYWWENIQINSINNLF